MDDQDDVSIFYKKNRTVIKKYPAFRDSFVNGPWKWIEGKRKDDYAEGLWRVHDKLYDLTAFIPKHPGGKYWLEVTKGTDVTEAFESHHLTSKPADLLKEYFKKNAIDPRNYFYTYDENGFYKTLKTRVSKKLKTVDYSVTFKARLIHDVNLFALFFAAIMMQRSDQNWLFFSWATVCGFCMALSTNLAHNFVHQADSWRMYTMNLSLITWRDCRVFHVLSHHMFPNTYSDFEVSTYEPYFKWIPTQVKSWRYRILSLILAPVLYLTFFQNIWRYRMQGYIWAKEKIFHWDELLTLALPAILAITSKGSIVLTEIYTRWTCIIILAEFIFACIYFNCGHHGSDQVHQNDEIRSLDFGEFQLSTTVDRSEANASTFSSLALHGDQVLHHLFPTLDSSILPQLRETLRQTCKEFDIDLRPETTMLQATLGHFKQLYRTETI